VRSLTMSPKASYEPEGDQTSALTIRTNAPPVQWQVSVEAIAERSYPLFGIGGVPRRRGRQRRSETPPLWRTRLNRFGGVLPAAVPKPGAISRDQRNTLRNCQAFKGGVDEDLGIVGGRAGRGVDTVAKGRVIGLDCARAGTSSAVGAVVYRGDRRPSPAPTPSVTSDTIDGGEGGDLSRPRGR
jgi:hypothetical protein